MVQHEGRLQSAAAPGPDLDQQLPEGDDDRAERPDAGLVLQERRVHLPGDDLPGPLQEHPLLAALGAAAHPGSDLPVTPVGPRILSACVGRAVSSLTVRAHARVANAARSTWSSGPLTRPACSIARIAR